MFLGARVIITGSTCRVLPRMGRGIRRQSVPRSHALVLAADEPHYGIAARIDPGVPPRHAANPRALLRDVFLQDTQGNGQMNQCRLIRKGLGLQRMIVVADGPAEAVREVPLFGQLGSDIGVGKADDCQFGRRSSLCGSRSQMRKTKFSGRPRCMMSRPKSYSRAQVKTSSPLLPWVLTAA